MKKAKIEDQLSETVSIACKTTQRVFESAKSTLKFHRKTHAEIQLFQKPGTMNCLKTISYIFWVHCIYSLLIFIVWFLVFTKAEFLHAFKYDRWGNWILVYFMITSNIIINYWKVKYPKLYFKIWFCKIFRINPVNCKVKYWIISHIMVRIEI